VSSHQVRACSRRVKLYRDQLIDNALSIDDSQDDFLQILHLIFDNARDQKVKKDPDNAPDKENKGAEDTANKSNSDINDGEKDSSQSKEMPFETASSVSLEKEYRKLYREIIKKVHPDRYDILGIESNYQVKRSQKIFQNAKFCAESNNEQGIVELCAQLEVDMDILDAQKTIVHLKDSEDQLVERIKAQEKSLQMMWHYNSDNLEVKTKIMMLYIEQAGKKGKNITPTLVKDVIASYNKDGTRKKRKVGQRPAKLKR